MNKTQRPAPTPANWASIIALGLIWGGTFMVVAIALKGYGPVTVAAARTALGSLALLGVMAVTRSPAAALYIAPDQIPAGHRCVEHRPALCPAQLGAATRAFGLCRHLNGGHPAVCAALGACLLG